MISFLAASLVITGVTICDGTGVECKPEMAIEVQGDRIVAILPEAEAPKADRVLHYPKATVTPGLIDLNTSLGLSEIRLVKAGEDYDTGASSPIRAAYRAQDSYNPYSPVIAIQRVAGITTAVSMPTGGLISGSATTHDLNGTMAPLAEALVVRLGGLAAGARGDRFAQLQEVVRDARAFARSPKAFLSTSFRRSAASRLDLERLAEALKAPIFVFVDRRADIERVAAWAGAEGLKIIIVGGAEAWMSAPMLAESKIPVVLNPTANQPRSFDTLHSRADSAALLAKAGVPVIISSFQTHLARRLRQWAGNAVRAGLPHGQALRAVTLAPAEALNLSDHGRVKVGALANLVIWNGDPFELDTQIFEVVIGGVVQSSQTRQSQLLDRYRRLPGPVRTGAQGTGPAPAAAP